MPSLDGYKGICRACFEPVSEGDEVQLCEGGHYYHRSCVENNPNSYYLALERIQGAFEGGKAALGELMSEMERIYRIPALRDKAYEAAHPEVIRLYRNISAARVFPEDKS